MLLLFIGECQTAVSLSLRVFLPLSLESGTCQLDEF